MGGETDTFVEEFGGETVEALGDQTEGQLCIDTTTKVLRVSQVERVIVIVADCLDPLSMDTWPDGCGEDLAPDLGR